MGSSTYPSSPASLFSSLARRNNFNASQVWAISLDEGKLHPRERNSRPVVCQSCRRTVLASAACKFVAARLGHVPGGYLCLDCIASALRSTDWQFQNLSEQLFPDQAWFSAAPFSGRDLAAAFLDKGERGLFELVSGDPQFLTQSA